MQRCVEMAECVQCETLIVVSIRKIQLEQNGLVVVANRDKVLVQCCVNNAKIVVRTRVIRFECYCELVILNCVLVSR